MGHGDRKTDLNPFQQGEAVLWKTRADAPAVYPGVVARIVAKDHVSVKFDKPVRLPGGREARGIVAHIKMLERR